MNGHIVPVAITPLRDGLQYIGLFVPHDGRYIIARKKLAADSARFDYATFQAATEFEWAMANPSLVTYGGQMEVEANLAILVNQFGSVPTMVQMTNFPAQQHVIVDNRADVQKVLVTNPTAAAGAPEVQPVSGTVTVANPTAATDVSALAREATLAAANVLLAAIKAKTDNLDVALSTRTKPGDTQPVSAASLPLPAGAATEATLALIKSALASPTLPSGGATAALQTSGNATLTAIASALAPAATAALQVTANGYLQALASAAQAPVALSRYRFVAAAGQNLTSWRQTPTSLYAVHVANTASSLRVLSLYNKATAPAAGDMPEVSLVIPPGATVRYALDGKPDQFPLGVAFSVGTSMGALTVLAGTLLAVLNAGDVAFTIHFA